MNTFFEALLSSIIFASSMPKIQGYIPYRGRETLQQNKSINGLAHQSKGVDLILSTLAE